jgi:alpha-amylase
MLKYLLPIFSIFFFIGVKAQEVLLQGWYWDYPKTTENANWADSLWFKAETLNAAGFTYVWLPPLTRSSSGNSSNGYDPKDLYDYGEYGNGATGFGSRSDLDNLIAKFNDNNINVIADLVYNHRDGGKMENNPGVKNYMDNYSWDKANSGANPFPYDRMRVILPIGGTTGLGTGNYYFKLRSASQHSNYYNWEYKVYAQTNTVGWQGAADDTEVEPNGGGNCGEANNTLQLGVNMNAQVDDGGCGIDEFHVSIGSSDYNSAGDTLFLYFGNRNSGYSDEKIIGIWYDGTGSDVVSQVEYQTYTDFSGMDSGQGSMNWSNFKPNLDQSTWLEGDWDGMYFFYDYDQFQGDTKTKLIDWTMWNWNNVGVRGLRMDAVKHFTPEFVGDMLDELHDNSMSPQIVVGEVFDLTASVLAGWVNSVYTYMDNDTKNSISPRVFDFALRDHLRKACDETATSDTRNIYSNSVVATGLSGYNVVTFINNHDFRDNLGYSSLIQNDAILAYAYILTNNQVGVPMVFYPDYFGYPTDETKFPYFPSNKAPLSDDIDKLISVNNNYIYGSTSIDELNRYSTPYSSNYISGNAYQSLIYQLSGGVAGKEVIVAINFSGVNLQVDHEIGMYNGLMAGSQLYDIVGNSAHPYAEVNSSNQIYIDLPPRSWSVWVQGNPVVPLSPTQLTINDASSDRISISWTDNSPNEDNFVIERKIGLNGTWAQLGMVDANLTTFVDSSAFSNSIDYFYRVYSTNAAGNSSATNEVLTKPYVAWQGYSGEWNSALNWLPPVIPDSNCDVIIPSSNEGGHSPTTVAGDYGSIKSLKLESGVEFIIPSGKTLEINE